MKQEEIQQNNLAKQSQTFEDSILIGIIEAVGKQYPEIECQIQPQRNPYGKVEFNVVGDVERCLEKVYQNCLVGSLDALKAVKANRQAIFSLKGNGYRHERNFNR